jgi:radical SAM superfamily enzyme YgiQ (UPF0313 family)/tetratricopeptide (TPR) repeat protein
MKTKKVMLIQPWNYHDEGVQHHDLSHEWRNGPYSLLMLATRLKVAKVPVRVVDLQPVLVLNEGNINKCLEHLEESINEFSPDIIGISFFSYQYNEVESIINQAKETCRTLNLNPLFVAGGIHASIEPELTIERLGFDYAFVGEGENAILDLAQGKEIKNIDGIVSNNGSVYKQAEIISDLNSLTFPDWHFCDYKFYSTPSYGKIAGRAARTLDIMMGRGCTYKCSFCAYSALSKTRFYSPEYLVDQMRAMKDLYDIDSVYFIDSSVGNNLSLLKQFCELVIKTGLAQEMSWYANMRANQIDEQLLKLMWDAGCRSLLYGFESGSQRMLDLMNKKCSVESNTKAAELHNKLNFPYHASMIMGYPGETEEDIYLTFDFLKKVRPPMVGINWYVPLPGSHDYEKLKKANLIKVDDPHEWRRIGEVLPTGKVYADIEEERFRALFHEACELASKLREEGDMDSWKGPETVVSEQSCVQPINKRNNGKSLDETEKGMENDYASISHSLREKWIEVPGTRQGRVFSSEMLKWPDDQLLSFWEDCEKETCVLEVRGWYQNVYKDMFRGCNIADVGPGVGLDGIFFAQHGAKVTFVDIVQDNLKLLERICKLKGIEARYYYIDDFFNFKFEDRFDAFLFVGSLINAPFDFTQRQVNAMTSFLKTGGKIAMLAYPKERYEQSGARDFAEFGKMTDGERTPWCEWYDDEKISALFGSDFRLEWSRDFGKDNIEFNWFDLTKSGNPEVNCSINEPSSLWLNFRGEHLFRNGSPEEAIETFTKAVSADPGLAVALSNIGVCYWSSGEVEKTKKYFLRALKIDQNDRDTVLNSIKVNVALSDVEGARKIYENYLKNNVEDEEISRILGEVNSSQKLEQVIHQQEHKWFPFISVTNLQTELGFEESSAKLEPSSIKLFDEWQMEIDDAPIFRYIYRNHKPRRHLEFGTWQGNGTVYCLEECNASVWTINLPFGENRDDESAAYGHYENELQTLKEWAEKIGLDNKDSYKTDSIGFIGRQYLERQLGKRVCQIYCDSRDWDISNYPADYFDSVLIDGGHTKEIVLNDTVKALHLTRSGGIILWHDFCPPMIKKNENVRGVVHAIMDEFDGLKSIMSKMFWIYPSMILCGIKK